MPAGYHRSHADLHFSLAEIPARNWMLILTHELQHALDPDLASGILAYNSPDLVKRFTAFANAGFSYQQLEPDDQRDLQAWIEAGPRFSAPTTGPFQLPLFQDAYQSVMSRYDDTHLPQIHLPWVAP